MKVIRSCKQIGIDIRDGVKCTVRRLSGMEPWIFRDVHSPILRLGSGDGAWRVAPHAIRQGGIVYSVGVGKDIGFDLEMISRYGAELHAFDPTPISQRWLETQQLPAGFHFHSIGLGSQNGEVRFEPPRSHGISFTSDPEMLQEPSKQTCIGHVCRLESLLQKLQHSRINLLKIDIEGAEYQIIDDLITSADRIDQLLLEFHHRMLGTRDAVNLTRDAIHRLRSAGYRVFDVSPRGIEVGFLGPRTAAT